MDSHVANMIQRYYDVGVWSMYHSVLGRGEVD